MGAPHRGLLIIWRAAGVWLGQMIIGRNQFFRFLFSLPAPPRMLEAAALTLAQPPWRLLGGCPSRRGHPPRRRAPEPPARYKKPIDT